MEKTLAATGRSIDTAAGYAGEIVVQAAGTAVAVAQGAQAVAGRLGKNVRDRTLDHGLLGLIVCPVPCMLYGAAAGAIDTIRGR